MSSGEDRPEMLVRYLLGYLSEEERESIADRAFADEQFADALEDAERDLLDAYVQGSLKPADRTAVETRLLMSEGQRAKLAFAKALTQRTRRRSRIIRLLPLAASALLLLGGGLWLFHSPTEKSTAVRQPPPQAPVQNPSPAPPVFAALLSPGGLRDGEVQQVTLPPGAPMVRFDLQLPNDPPAQSYALRLMRNRETIVQQTDITPHSEAGAEILSAVFNSNDLAAGSYRISVLPNNTPQPLDYTFQIR
jgi:hypothetical protein